MIYVIYSSDYTVHSKTLVMRYWCHYLIRLIPNICTFLVLTEYMYVRIQRNRKVVREHYKEGGRGNTIRKEVGSGTEPRQEALKEQDDLILTDAN